MHLGPGRGRCVHLEVDTLVELDLRYIQSGFILSSAPTVTSVTQVNRPGNLVEKGGDQDPIDVRWLLVLKRFQRGRVINSALHRVQ